MFAQRVHDGQCHVIERLRASGAEVVDAGNRAVPEVQVHLDDIVDMDEVALLRAVGVAMASFEQPNLAVGPELVEVMECHRRHAALVRFARAVHVEVPQADHRRLEPGNSRRTIWSNRNLE